MTALIHPVSVAPLQPPKRLSRGRVQVGLRDIQLNWLASSQPNLRRWVAARLRRVSPSDLRVALPCWNY
jgi:hypothetical protein